MKNTKLEKNFNAEKSSPFIYILKGTLIAYALTLISFIIYAMLLTYSDMTEKNLTTVVTITILISCMVSGFDVARATKNKGLIYGSISGFIYALIMFFIGFCVVPNYNFSSSTLINLILGVVGGGFGGIIGVIKK